jgi:hypothetical protein
VPTAVAAFTFKHYRRILEAGLESGYRFIGFDELAGLRDRERYLCLLRHDCEGDLAAALRLGEMEKTLDVKSTYFLQLRSPLYNVLSEPQARFVKELIELGHRLGLHFDERSHSRATPAQIADLVDRERALLGEEFGVTVAVVSFHQPSARVLENRLKLRCLNTYDRSDMQGAGYLSDSNWQWKLDPIDAFQSRTHPHLQLLLHPECWTDRSMSIERKWHEVLRHNTQIAQQTLIEREATYKTPAKISFRS